MRPNVQNPSPARRLSVAIVGATGAVGVELLRCLEDAASRWPACTCWPRRARAGRRMAFQGQEIEVEALTSSFEGIDIALFSAGGGISRQYAPKAVAAGAVVVDNSSAFRMDPGVPLVVPEMNAEEIAGTTASSPTPTAWPSSRWRRSGRWTRQTRSAASCWRPTRPPRAPAPRRWRSCAPRPRPSSPGRPFPPQVLPHHYAFNLFSHNAEVDPESGYNGEETKVSRRRARSSDAPDLPIGADLHPRAGAARALRSRSRSNSTTRSSPTRARRSWPRAGRAGRRRSGRNHFPMPKRA